MITPRARRPGRLPEGSDASIGSVRLPAGVLVSPDPSFASGGATGPALWVTRERVAKVGRLWDQVAAVFAEHGLWPLVLESLRGTDDRPWLAGEIDPAQSSSPDKHDVKAVLRDQWANVVPVPEEDPEAFVPLLPFGATFPGLAPPSAGTADEKALRAVVARLEGRLGLVAVERPADALVVIGWSGPVNHYSDMGLLSAVLRSWEDRFGAVLVGVGFDTMTLAVARPPEDAKLALSIAAEHFAMCSDNVHQGAGSIEEYATGLVGEQAWTFWWD